MSLSFQVHLCLAEKIVGTHLKLEEKKSHNLFLLVG